MEEEMHVEEPAVSSVEVPTDQVAAVPDDTETAVHAAAEAAPEADGPSDGPAEPSFVYALGRIEPRFPSLGVEKEFAQARARSDTSGLNDREVFRAVITDGANRYLARQICWVLVIEGLETYILIPRDPADYQLLIDSYREDPGDDDVDIVVGLRAQIAPADMCNGLAVPIVVFDQIYSFSRESLIDAIPKPDSVTEKNERRFRDTATRLFDEIQQIADNSGATDEHRALNYLTVRYPTIYGNAAEAQERNESLAAVDVRLSPLSGVRKVVDVVFSYVNRQTDVTARHFVRVDVTEEYPFLVGKLSPYFEH